MASQKEKVDEALLAKAKELGIKGAHLCSEETLKEKIADAEGSNEPEVKVEKPKVETPEVEEKVERKTAPRMNVQGIARDDRTAMIQKLEAEDPECKYVFQSNKVTDRELAAKGLERTKFQVRNDIVCRTLREGFDEYQQEKNKAQYKAMQRIDGGKGIVGNFEASAKTPKS